MKKSLRSFFNPPRRTEPKEAANPVTGEKLMQWQTVSDSFFLFSGESLPESLSNTKVAQGRTRRYLIDLVKFSCIESIRKSNHYSSSRLLFSGEARPERFSAFLILAALIFLVTSLHQGKEVNELLPASAFTNSF
ncbi:MAG: hypothetical protein ABIN67_20930 [Ferruginibacter sp.]